MIMPGFTGEGEVGEIPPKVAGRTATSVNFLMVALLFLISGAALGAGLFPDSALTFVFVTSGWLVGTCLHEGAHAHAAWRAGDHGMPGTGYLSFDPARFAHPVTSVLLPLALIALGFLALPGGAMAYDRSRIRSPRLESLVALAGPAANLAFLAAAAGALALSASPELRGALAMLALLQAMAAVVNLLPVPGFDGWAALRPFLPPGAAEAGDRFGTRWSFLIFALLFLTPAYRLTLIPAGLITFVAFGIPTDDFVTGWRAFPFWS